MNIPNVSNPILFDLIFKLSGFYKIYERWLESQISRDVLPNHVAIILDGNRRWAKYHYFGVDKAHNVGAEKAEELLNWIYDLEIKITTIYVLSNENLERENEELTNIYALLSKKLTKLRDDNRIHKRKMKIKAIGNIELLPKNLQHILKILVDAIKKIASMVSSGKLKVSDIDKKIIESCLYTSHLPQSDPDLILRTSGEKRLSGFLLWQSAYSELIFMDVFWPEFRKIDFMRAIRTYQNRIRRFGK